MKRKPSEWLKWVKMHLENGTKCCDNYEPVDS